jgi:antitoxin YefM
MTVTNITDFRSNAKQYIDNVIKDNSALVINRGRTAAVLISLEEYNSIKETELLMSSRGYNCVKEGVEQYYNNDLVTVDIDDL